MESSRTSLASRTSLRTDFEVLGLEASSPRKLACQNFGMLKFCGALEKFFGKRFLVEIAWKIFVKTFFFWRALALCVFDPWPWAFLSLASRVFVLGKAVFGLGLGFFLCPWPWPRALCPRLHLCCAVRSSILQSAILLKTTRKPLKLCCFEPVQNLVSFLIWNLIFFGCSS